MSFDVDAMKQALNEREDENSPLTPEAMKIVKTAVEQQVEALTASDEQVIRDRAGYSKSERRTFAERLEAANRIRLKLGLPLADGTREEAIARGAVLGEAYALQLEETGASAQQRIARAKAYAAWEYDGKPLGNWEAYKQEFDIGGTTPLLSGLRR